jgi:CheY-like chemotaxis protein
MQPAILVVDDETSLLKLNTFLLSKFGYQVLSASSGPSAIEAWKKHQAPIDLLLTDVFMPGMTGPKLAAELAALQPGLKVVFTSGSTREELDSLFPNPEEIRLLCKPASPEVLKECVREAIAGE